MKGIRAILALTALLILAAAVSGWCQGQIIPARYDIRATLDTQTDMLVGTQIVIYTNDSETPVDEIVFALIANWGAEENPFVDAALLDPDYTSGFDPTWTHVHRVTTADGEELSFRLEHSPPAMQTYSLRNGLLVIDLPQSLQPGETATLSLRFETHFASARIGDNCVTRDTYVWRFGWHPVIVDPSARDGVFELPSAEYAVTLTIPDSYRAYGGADHQSSVASPVGQTTVEFTNDRPVRSVPLLIGRNLDSVSSTWNGITIEAVYLPGGEQYARAALSYATEILAAHMQFSGALTAQRVVIAQNPAPGFFGLAADGMIFVGASLIELQDMPAQGIYDRLNEYLLAHELAHLWWGIGIGADFNADNWISEGFAEFLAVSYFEAKYGAMDPNLLNHLQGGLVEDLIVDAYGGLNLRRHMEELPYLRLLQLGFDEPIVQPLADSNFANGTTIRTYSKGYLVLRSLEAVLGRDAMQRLLVEAHASWDGRRLTIDALQDLAETVSRRDLAVFFQDWVTGATQSNAGIVHVDIETGPADFIAEVLITPAGPAFPVILEATLEDGTTLRETLAPGVNPVTVRFQSDVRFASFSVDPEERIIDTNRYNNHWPRKLLVSHPFQTERGPTIGMPLDAYVIDVSPFGISGGFRNDHAWSLMALPHINAEPNTFGSLDDPLAVDAVGSFVSVLGRDTTVSLAVSLTEWHIGTWEGEFSARLSLDLLTFAHPETGAPGTYWYPRWQSTLAIGAMGPLSSPFPYVSWTVLWDGLPARILNHVLAVRLGIPGVASPHFGTVEWRASHRLRLAPLFYLDLAASAAETLFADLPDPFLFSLDELHAFPYLPMGHHQLFGRMELVFPPWVRGAGYAVFNLTRIDSVTASLYVQGGRTQANCVSVCEPGIRAEAGAKLTVSFPLFMGQAASLTVGYALPLIGDEGTGTVFFEIGGLL